MTKIGIEAASFFVPSLYLEIKDLAEKRGIEPAKLEKGLGLHKMAFPDVHEDAATLAAEELMPLFAVIAVETGLPGILGVGIDKFAGKVLLLINKLSTLVEGKGLTLAKARFGEHK